MIFKKSYQSFKQKKSWLTEISYFAIQGIKHGKSLSLTQNNIINIRKDDIILFSVMKNEAHRLNFFLEYYRKLGINHFIFVDNGSTDHFTNIIQNQSDISVFYTEASYKASNYGMHWLNYLLYHYGTGHWCLTCDPDEFFVYPYMDTRDLRDLTDYLSSTRTSSCFALMLDMYAKTSVEESYYTEGTDPLLVCPYFDMTGYQKQESKHYRNLFIQGGVRQRIFYPDNPSKAPALNKIPLVKWERHFAYVQSMHMLIPRKLNQVVQAHHITGALLHYKFIAQLSQKIAEEQTAQQHWDNSSEYQKYASAIEQKTHLYHPNISIEYQDWRTLVKQGIISWGEWSS